MKCFYCQLSLGSIALHPECEQSPVTGLIVQESYPVRVLPLLVTLLVLVAALVFALVLATMSVSVSVSTVVSPSAMTVTVAMASFITASFCNQS